MFYHGLDFKSSWPPLAATIRMDTSLGIEPRLSTLQEDAFPLGDEV